MKTFAKFEDILLKCVPEKWAIFYKKAPKEFKHEHIIKAGYTRKEFLELAEATKFFDYSDYENDQARSVYKDYEYVPKDCDSWFLNEKEMALYNAMPEKFSQDLFRAKRLAMNMPISSQDRMLDGTLFKTIEVEGTNYFDLEKGFIVPVLRR